MRGSAQTAKAWRSWHRSLHLRTRRSAQFQYLRLHQGDEGKQVPSTFGYLTILAKTAKTFRSLLPSCPDFCVNVKGAHPPPPELDMKATSLLIIYQSLLDPPQDIF
ncbi:hypothetical protein CDV31_012747 [Fusarium ambrosium]|uniref:Uncharacterized protein n=1 Tax=Fusarium ambrosium TaxID=131363 RepID=A0A428T7U1_9HYPO|nr:hypothetical protein CDV31_012747 [Fusarium ambrosium]